MTTNSAGPSQGLDIAKTVSTRVNGIDVEGVMTGCSWDVDVEITAPFSDLILGSHIPLFARALPRSFEGEYGEIRAKQMLAHLYLIGEHISRNFTTLARKLAEHRKRIAGLPESQVWELDDQFFEANFPVLISVGTRQSVIDILDGRKLLSTKSS